MEHTNTQWAGAGAGVFVAKSKGSIHSNLKKTACSRFSWLLSDNYGWRHYILVNVMSQEGLGELLAYESD